MSTTIRRLAPVFVLVLALAIAGCGGDDENGAGGDASTDLSTVATEYEFDPDEWTVPAGEEVSITLDNQGEIIHEWVVLEEGVSIDSSGDFTEDMALFEVEAEAGEQAEGTFTAPSTPAEHQVVCAIPGHLEQGMEGTLNVVEPSS